MVKIKFDLVAGTEIQVLERGKKHFIPFGTTHIGLKAGKIAFFVSNDSLPYYKSRNHWHFFCILSIKPIPQEVVYPKYEMTSAGHFYGQPLFN